MDRIDIAYTTRLDHVVAHAADVLREGGIILYPTDTLYGLGADALSDDAVDKLYDIKGREEDKPIHAIVADMEMAARYGHVNDYADMLSKRFLPGPLTLVLQKKDELQTGIGRGISTVGLRIPSHDFCRALAQEFGRPITTTSANRSGMPPHHSVNAILEQLGVQARDIDLVLDEGEKNSPLPSTVIDLRAAHPVILREGAISAPEIWSELEIEEPEATG